MSDPNENRPGYKKTKVGWIPELWEITHFEKTSKLVRGPFGGALKKEIFVESGYKVYEQKHAIKNDFSLGSYYVDGAKYNEMIRFALNSGDYIMSCSGTAGRLARVPDEFDEGIINQALLKITPKIDIVDSNYLGFYFNGYHFQNGLFGGMAGGAIKNIAGIPAIKQIPIALPTLPEQKKIADILSTWDRAIDKTRDLIEAKRKQKKGLMQQLLTGKKRLPGFEGEWNEVRISTLLKEISSPVDWSDEDTYNLISVRRRSGGAFHRESLQGSQIKTKVMYTAAAGDFLISKMQVLHGATGIVPDALDGFHISGSYISLRPKAGAVLDMDFLSYLSATKEFYHLTYLASYGVHIEKMTFKLDWFMKSTLFLPPTIEEQTAIAKVLGTTDREIQLMESKLAALEQQKKGLMQRLLTGQIRVKVDAA